MQKKNIPEWVKGARIGMFLPQAVQVISTWHITAPWKDKGQMQRPHSHTSQKWVTGAPRKHRHFLPQFSKHPPQGSQNNQQQSLGRKVPKSHIVGVTEGCPFRWVHISTYQHEKQVNKFQMFLMGDTSFWNRIKKKRSNLKVVNTK